MPISSDNTSHDLRLELEASLQVYGKGLALQVFRALTLLEAEILQNLRSRSGLHVRSGALINSVAASKKITNDGHGNVTGEIGSVGVPYARIHEFGGTTRPHVIRPRNASVLAFQKNGQDVFARFVNHPGSKIPARPYLAPALKTKQEEILKTFGLFLSASFKL